MSERSVTEAITNQTVFSSGELLEKLPELTDPRQPPPSALLPTFLHEATHHWCFTSTVGTAIAVLALRGRIHALRAIEAGTPQEAKTWELRAADDLVRAEVASLWLQPLAEGMATFAEFDLATSLRSPALPPPLRWATLFAARDKLTGSGDTRVRRRMDMAQATVAALMAARGSERARRAKEALLAGPLRCDAGGGYLAGYLLVKALWSSMRRHHDRFLEPDVFLLKVYDIFYEDGELVRLLLDRSETIPSALNPLGPHLVQRVKSAFQESKDSLQQFYDGLIAARSRLYDDEKVGGKVLPLANSIDADPSARFLAIWDAVMGGPITQLPRDAVGASRWQTGMVAMHMIGYGRDLLQLGSLPVQLKVGETNTDVQANGQAVVRLRTVSKAHMGETTGTLHILLNTRNGDYVVVAASATSEMVALQNTSEAAMADDVSLRRSVMGRLGGAAVANAMMLEAAESLNQLHELSRMSGYLQQTRERLSGLYVPFATDHVPDSQIEALLPKMMTDGIYGAFDRDADLVRALAILGSTAHVSWMPEHLKAEFEKEGLEYEPLMRKLREYARSTNLFTLSEEFGVRCSL